MHTPNRWFLGLLLLSANSLAAAGPFTLRPAATRQGQAVLLRVRKPLESLVVTAGPQTVALWPCGKAGAQRCGIVGVPLDTPVGFFGVDFKWNEQGQEKVRTLPLKVRKGKFRVNRLKVEPALTSPSEEDKKRIEQDRKDFATAYASPEPAPLWTGRFALPTGGEITSLFGNQRTYNGEVKSTHFGVDLRAGTKTPIHAVAAGKVLLAKEFFMAGNLVLIDHGSGIFSSYAHLSKIDVSVGENVERGKKVGMAGATGRVTGPHLHWSMRVNGVPVDPHSARAAVNHAFKGDVRR
jgi:hypothetical protein